MNRASLERQITLQETEARAWAHYRPARPGLWIFGAGDDALPLQRLAREFGWFITVADGRSHLASRERFHQADEVRVLQMNEWPGGSTNASATLLAGIKPEDAAIVMTHSFEQDSKILASLLSLAAPPAYIGVLGPQRRTRELLAEANVCWTCRQAQAAHRWNDGSRACMRRPALTWARILPRRSPCRCSLKFRSFVPPPLRCRCGRCALRQ